ncbi:MULTISPECIES: hypothetical protein [unclassified Streptomyces]|uniref:hypothetical protein n=1 Tax=unclassified Streptomyces TaxID=2593676 RepID=UPI00081B36D1|nr:MULTISPECIES: hypothetical protein [unclassified Streptomyces]MYQ85458.1 hypothetical protein [Streptomyces sp. SID4936]SCE05194.1 hypothetical protein GA0115234_1056218 [Streptomyces sp. DvalAA-43]
MAGRGRLKAAVYVQDPSSREELILLPGECPDQEVAVLITNPDAWEELPEDGDELVSVEKSEQSADEADGQEAAAGGGGAKKSASSRRGGGRSASASS